VLGEQEEDKETGEQGEEEEEMAMVNICCSNIYVHTFCLLLSIYAGEEEENEGWFLCNCLSKIMITVQA